jgi:uncharacterized protein (TIRG00374 family)
LLAALLITSLALITSILKWDALLRSLKINAPKLRLLKIYTIGFFASAFLPGVMGGDVLRWHLTGKFTGQPLQVAATILVERATGVVGLVIMSIVAAGVVVPEFATVPVWILLGSMAASIVVGAALALNRRIGTVVTYRCRHSRLRSIVNSLHKLQRVLRRFSRRALFVALIWSFVFYISGGLALFCIAQAFGANLNLFEAITEQLLICSLTLIPISLGGLGLAQAGDIYLFSVVGVGAAQAFGISIMRQIIAYVYVLIGGLLFITGRQSTCSISMDDVSFDSGLGESQDLNMTVTKAERGQRTN